MKKFVLSAAALAAAIPVLPAAADPPPWAPAYGRRAHETQGYYDQSYYNQGYDQGYSGRVRRGRNGGHYCRRSNGAAGLPIGGAAGALLGREVQRSASRCR